jgi:hypothetical protein
MATIDQLLRDKPKDNTSAETPGAKESSETPEDPCCTPPAGDPGPDRGI